MARARYQEGTLRIRGKGSAAHRRTRIRIYDSSGKNARILGIEYIISDAIYRSLPDDEKGRMHEQGWQHYLTQVGDAMAGRRSKHRVRP